MKKLLVLLLVFAIVLGITGCVAQPLVNNDVGYSAVEQTQAQTEALTEALTEPPTEAPTVAVTEPKAEEIGEGKAKAIALDHAKLKESDVTALFVELDYDDGLLRYEVDFRQGSYEYDYDIDAKTGKILSYDKDFDD